MSHYFSYKTEDYKRELDPLAGYIEIQSFYLSRMTGKPIEKCKDFVVKSIQPDGIYPMNNRRVKYLHRETQNGDRVKGMTTILDYIKYVNDNNLTMSPSMTVYIPSKVFKSLYTEYIDYESAIRSKYKHAMFEAEQRDDQPAIAYNNEMQQTAKIGINSLSGAALSPSTINYCGSLHPTLTSTCAASTSYANLNNEKLIAGNRAYLTYQNTLDNIISIVLRADYNMMTEAIDDFNIHYPTVEETMSVIKDSTDLYWRDDKKLDKIFQLVSRLTPIERAAVCYIGDLHHMYELNPELISDYLLGYTKRSYEETDLETAKAINKEADSDTEILAKLICKDYMAGKSLKDLQQEDPKKYSQICINMRNIMNHDKKYASLIRAFLRPPFLNTGANIISMHALSRKAVLTSDTDSTIFTSQQWVKRLTGSIGFEDKHYNVGFTVSYLVNKTVFHQLALMSRNLGIEEKYTHMISMKNEFYFPTYVITNSAKNYFAYKSVREGNVYTRMQLEKKGVELRSARIPKNVMNQFDDWICSLMDKIIEKQNLTLEDVFKAPKETELEVKNSIISGDSKYLQTIQIKSADSYKQGDSAPALFYNRLWEEVFAPKYGSAPELPYVALKLSTTVKNKTTLQKWYDQIQDPALKKRLVTFLERENRKDLGTLFVPKMVVSGKSMPEELALIIDPSKQLMNVMNPYYLSLESLGFYLRNPNNTTMIHRYYNG